MSAETWRAQLDAYWSDKQRTLTDQYLKLLETTHSAEERESRRAKILQAAETLAKNAMRGIF